MKGIILELQREVLDEKVNLDSLLRKSYLIAKKLELPIFEDWIKHEQNGYGEYEIPEYRRVRGQVKGLNNGGRWIPVILSSVAAEERFTTVRLPSSISQLLDLYKRDQEATVGLAFPVEENQLLIKSCGHNTQYVLEVGKDQIYAIIDAVRNIILEWAIDLEQKGIIGENLSFTDKERITASQDFANISYYNYIVGSNSDIHIRQGSQDNIQELVNIENNREEHNIMDKKESNVWNVNGGQVNVASGNATIHATQNNGVSGKELDDIIKGIKDSLSDLKKEDADKIADIVELAEDELIKPEPKVSRLRNCLALIAPMFTIANGIPTLANNLQRLQELINLHIH